jgi:hypothetical protein
MTGVTGQHLHWPTQYGTHRDTHPAYVQRPRRSTLDTWRFNNPTSSSRQKQISPVEITMLSAARRSLVASAAQQLKLAGFTRSMALSGVKGFDEHESAVENLYFNKVCCKELWNASTIVCAHTESLAEARWARRHPCCVVHGAANERACDMAHAMAAPSASRSPHNPVRRRTSASCARSWAR